MQMFRTCSLTLAAAATVALTGAALANHIDFLNQGAFDLTADSGNATAQLEQTGLSTANVLGGKRNTTLTWLAGVSSPPLQVRADLFPNIPAGPSGDPDRGSLFFSADARQQGSLLLEYGVGAPLNADFASQWNSATLFITGDHDADVEFTFNGVSRSKAFNEGDTSVVIVFSEFGGVNFSDIDTASFRVTGQLDGDYTIASFERTGSNIPPVIPTPAAFASGLALMGAVIFRRRRQA